MSFWLPGEVAALQEGMGIRPSAPTADREVGYQDPPVKIPITIRAIGKAEPEGRKVPEGLRGTRHLGRQGLAWGRLRPPREPTRFRAAAVAAVGTAEEQAVMLEERAAAVQAI